LWHARRSRRFVNRYERLSDELADQVDEAIRTLLSAERPERYGELKKGKRKGYFAWDLGRSCRMLFRPDYSERIIDFFRVCSHKEVYGP